MTRNGAQIRSHAQKFFIKLKKDCEGNDLDELSTKYQQ